ncbi:MAG: radical SAM protein, partial [bacterium]|nr:radical SAM protein [bacterium]
IVNPQKELIQNLDELPFPARHLVPFQKYSSVLAKKFPVTTMFTSRGCPYRCLFCDRPHLGKFFRARSASNVVDEFEKCVRMGIKEIFIYDDTFGVDRQRVLDICQGIIKRKIDISWDIRTRVNTVDEEILIALKNAGCQRIHYGVEAGTQRILNILRKGITLEMAEKAFRLTKKAGIQTAGYFIIGSPSETEEEILATINFAKKLNPDFVHFTILTPYPATDLYRFGLETGVIKYDYWKEFAQTPSLDFSPPVWEEIFSKDELNKLLKKAYRSFYFRPGYVLKRLREVSSFKEFLAKAGMALKLLKI